MLIGFDSTFPEELPPAVAISSPISVNASPPANDLATQPLRTKPPFPTEGDLVILVDSHSLIYQVFHALPAMTSPTGIEVGAAHGFLRDVAHLLEQWKPDFFVCTFDISEKTFRNDLYDQYKANREAMPDALREQIPLIHRCLDTLAIPKISAPGFEADDIMATLAHQAEQQGARVLLVTSDKDCRQLITDRVQMLNVRKNEVFGEPELRTVWGIRPDQVVDFQSLVGDSVDNVPGVPQIGPKAAQQLLEQFNTLDDVLENIDLVAGEKRKENLRNNRDLALLSRDLVRLSRECPIELAWSQMRPGTFDRQAALDLFRELGFRKLSDAFVALLGTIEPAVVFQLPTDGYRLTDQPEQLDELIQTLASVETIAIDTETTSTRPRDAELVGISLSWAEGQAAYIPVRAPEGTPVLELDLVRSKLAPLLADVRKSFIGQNLSLIHI